MRVKVCCIAGVAEAELALAHGASALGLVSQMPSGPGVIDDATIREVARWAPREVRTFLLTSRTDPHAIAAQVREAGVNTVQLVDALAPGAHAVLRAALPGIVIVQVVHVRDASSVDEALALAPAVDAVGPHGLDVCSGVRIEGRLSADRLQSFVRAVTG